ncbi:hypothetical protein K438DRAFT_1782748 [Mycena galopus ATCC 62051]|nr:hypothetical protein K438DRAFT_1782748 [Mycena galopus ATCC 62051]
MSKPIPEKRTRVYIACMTCRRRKTKCETNHPGNPCKRCSRRGLACEYISIRDELGQLNSARTPAASGYDSSIFQPRSPAPEATASYSAVQAPAPTSLQAGHAFLQSAQWGPTWVDTTTRTTESGSNFAHYPAGQPVHPEYHPNCVPSQGYSRSGYDSSHPLPYSASPEPPYQSGSMTHPSQWPASFSAFSQPQPCMHGSLCNCGVPAPDFF